MPSIEVLIPCNLPPDVFRRRVCMTAIKGRYGTVGEFATSIGCSRFMVYMVMAGKYPTGRVATALASLTGIARHTLFPPAEKAA